MVGTALKGQISYESEMVARVGICCNCSGTSLCGHPTYVDIMLSWTLFLGPVHGVHNIISFTTVDFPQFWTLFVQFGSFVQPSDVHISEVLLCNGKDYKP